MKKYLTALTLASALCAIGMPSAFAETGAPAATATKKQPAKKKAAHPKAAAAAAKPAEKMALSSDADDDENEPEIGGTKSADFQCEMGHKLTIWKNEADDKHIAIRWDKRIHRLTRVETTTGANRFENRKMGLVWIGIPAKGLLLDSKKGQQLANECKNAEQIKAAEAAPAATVAAAPQKN
ncbi:hypothetical protein [Herbaspirillum huttiense]|uniref:hypothetical protein n=1 Tax=Herbaspirillum huttiense TaxID=863372 RepID=UPI0003FBED10|nr:hypothetical protein [Herbaspirillum huttiense]